jgi:hypothetical protein
MKGFVWFSFLGCQNFIIIKMEEKLRTALTEEQERHELAVAELQERIKRTIKNQKRLARIDAYPQSEDENHCPLYRPQKWMLPVSRFIGLESRPWLPQRLADEPGSLPGEPRVIKDRSGI